MVVITGFGLGQGTARAQPNEPQTPPVDVLQVSGFLDKIMANGIRQAIVTAGSDGSQALVLQVNLKGTVIPDSDVVELAELMLGSKVPVAMWVGPSGAKAVGVAGQLMAVAAVNGMAPGSKIGNFGDPLVVGGKSLAFGEATDRLRNGRLGYTDARKLGALKPGNDAGGTAVLGEMIVALDGVTVNGTTLHTARSIERDGQPGRTVSGNTRFSKLGLVDQLFHTVASPAVAYLLIIIGLCLLLFEFFTAGVGVAGVLAAICTILGCFGLVALPTRWWAFGLLVLAIVAFGIDVQAGLPRLWTGIGVAAFVVASRFLFHGIYLSWVSLLVGIGGVLATFLSGMPSMVRTRFSTPTIGREWMIGREGVATADIKPDGVVRVGEGVWRARTNRATPIASGDAIRVAAIDGITLEVEPLTGAARDYRERRPKGEPNPDP